MCRLHLGNFYFRLTDSHDVFVESADQEVIAWFHIEDDIFYLMMTNPKYERIVIEHVISLYLEYVGKRSYWQSALLPVSSGCGSLPLCLTCDRLLGAHKPICPLLRSTIKET